MSHEKLNVKKVQSAEGAGKMKKNFLSLKQKKS